MKALDIIKLLSTRVDSPELVELTQDPDKELTEDQAQSVKNALLNLMSKEAAKNNPEIIEAVKSEYFPVHKKTVLKDFEDKIKPLADKLGVSLEGKKFADEMFSAVTKAIEEKGLPKSDEIVESLKSERQKLSEQLESTKTEYEQKLKEIQQSQRNKELFREFENKFNNYNLADSYKDEFVLKSLKKSLWEDITSKAHLDLSDEGIKVFEKEMPEKELYLNNKKATLETLLEPKISSYLKKAEPEPSRRQPETNSRPSFKNSYQERYATQRNN